MPPEPNQTNRRSAMSEDKNLMCAVVELFIYQGLTLSDIISVYAKRRTDEEKALVKKAIEEFHEEGELEIDENAYVSLPETDAKVEPHTGAYVLGWVWVEK